MLGVCKHGFFSDFFLFFLLRLCPRKAHFIIKQKKTTINLIESNVLFLALCLNLIKFTSTSKFAIIYSLVKKPINSLQRLKSQNFRDTGGLNSLPKTILSTLCNTDIVPDIITLPVVSESQQARAQFRYCTVFIISPTFIRVVFLYQSGIMIF